MFYSPNHIVRQLHGMNSTKSIDRYSTAIRGKNILSIVRKQYDEDEMECKPLLLDWYYDLALN